PGRYAVDLFESPGKVELVGVAHRVSDIADGESGKLQQLAGLGHPVIDQKFLGGFTCGIPEDFAEIAAVQSAESRDIFNGYIILKVLFDKGKRLFNIKIPHTVSISRKDGLYGTGQIVHKQIQMAREMEGRLLRVPDNIEKFFRHLPAQILLMGTVNRRVRGKTGAFQ